MNELTKGGKAVGRTINERYFQRNIPAIRSKKDEIVSGELEEHQHFGEVWKGEGKRSSLQPSDEVFKGLDG